MRRAFLAELVVAMAAAAAWVASGREPIAILLTIAAAGLFLLWAAHVAMHAWRVAGTMAVSTSSATAPDLERRRSLRAFSVMLGGVALATALPMRHARADVSCGSNEWCYRHDFTKKNNPCVKCCPK